jgi:hypothetical protein
VAGYPDDFLARITSIDAQTSIVLTLAPGGPWESWAGGRPQGAHGSNPANVSLAPELVMEVMGGAGQAFNHRFMTVVIKYHLEAGKWIFSRIITLISSLKIKGLMIKI